MNRWAILLVSVVVVVVVIGLVSRSRNAAVVEELRAEPDGERAKKVMALTLPSGRTIPVNYLREGDTVYAGADFPWWRELRPRGGRGSVLIRGETLPGYIRAIEDDPERRTAVFARLRPNAVPWWGVLVVIELDSEARKRPDFGLHGVTKRYAWTEAITEWIAKVNGPTEHVGWFA